LSGSIGVPLQQLHQALPLGCLYAHLVGDGNDNLNPWDIVWRMAEVVVVVAMASRYGTSATP
jgi:hypothetical protein